jgi:ketosteroid isomerase-like protein
MRKLVLFAFGLAFALALRAGDAAGEIRELLQVQSAAWNRGDLDGFMQAYEHTETLRFASGGTVTRGWQTTLDRYKKRYPDRAAMGVLAYQLLDVNVLSADAAVVFGQWELAREKDHPWGLFTLTLRRTDAGWRIVADHTSSAEK